MAVTGTPCGAGDRARLWTGAVTVASALAALAIASVPARASLGPAPPPSTIIYGESSIPLHFDHSLHLKQVSDCTFCHTTIRQSVSAQADDLPRESECESCHAIDRSQPDKASSPPAACAACHAGFVKGEAVAPLQLASPDIKFNHKIHLDRGVACATCHGDMRAVSDTAGLRQLPRMSTCLTCHDGNTAPSACATCHLTNPDGTLLTALPRGSLMPTGQLRGDAHDMTFRTEHAAVAKSDEAYCLSCHKEKECLDCHEGVVKPFDFHGNDYITKHPIDAERDSLQCQSCHRRQDFCLSCHERSGVAIEPVNQQGFGYYDPGGLGPTPLASPFRATGPSFHPVYADGRQWGSYLDTSPVANQHQFFAERNIGACVSCHSERFCMNCHSDVGFGGSIGANPHGPDWVSSGRCQSLLSRNPRMCLECHANTSAEPFAADMRCQ